MKQRINITLMIDEKDAELIRKGFYLSWIMRENTK